jgi:hypothetical protein
VHVFAPLIRHLTFDEHFLIDRLARRGRFVVLPTP